ncbi:hypothetical protein [Ruania rhizosphaerae]|uniref:hypothetical protein n=1 Tax=Ruania rhizosphaerae TaxID=1840413 RepID=UPI00135C3554|nr:hypothetical protein [Ruania rhizosphaerae]
MTAIAASVLFLAGCTANDGEASAAPDEPSSSAAVTEEPSEAEASEIDVQGAVGLGGGAVLHDVPEDGMCMGHSEWTVIKEGVQVTIEDAAGSIVATTTLRAGERYQDSEDCLWWFEASVPTGGEFYSAHVLDWSSDVVPEDEVSFTPFAVLPAG